MKRFHTCKTAGIIAMAVFTSQPVFAQSAAGVLVFALPGVQIIDANGVTRPALQGDQIKGGERLLTPPDAISQLKLPDGSLVSLRPGSELKVELPPAASSGQAPIVMSLINGAVRVVGAELMDKLKPSLVTLQTGQTSLRLSGADIESAVLRAGAKPTLPGAVDVATPGTYNRLAAGSAILTSGTVVEPLPIREVSFVAVNNPLPTILPTLSPTILSSAAPLSGLRTLSVSPLPVLTSTSIDKLETPLPTLSLSEPLRTTSTLTTLRLEPISTVSTTTAVPLVFSPISTGSISTTTITATALPTAITPTTTLAIAPITIQPVIAPVLLQPLTTVIKPPLTCTRNILGQLICK